MTTKEYQNKARQIKNEMRTRRDAVRATHNELIQLLKCHEAEEYSPMQNTKLYNNHSGEYCEYLSMLD